MNAAELILTAGGSYLGLGLAFAAAFVTRGVASIDDAARDAPLGFRLLLLPGATVLWPLLARRWLLARAAGRHS
jgi:hypothetical protein